MSIPESGTDGVARRLGDQYGTGTCHRGYAAGHIDRPAEPVSGTADCLSRRNAGPDTRQSSSAARSTRSRIDFSSKTGSGHTNITASDGFDEPDRINLHVVGKPIGSFPASRHGAVLMVIGPSSPEWWVPDTTGVLGELVRRTSQYRQIPEDKVVGVKMRLAVNAAARVAPALTAANSCSRPSGTLIGFPGLCPAFSRECVTCCFVASRVGFGRRPGGRARRTARCGRIPSGRRRR